MASPTLMTSFQRKCVACRGTALGGRCAICEFYNFQRACETSSESVIEVPPLPERVLRSIQNVTKQGVMRENAPKKGVRGDGYLTLSHSGKIQLVSQPSLRKGERRVEGREGDQLARRENTVPHSERHTHDSCSGAEKNSGMESTTVIFHRRRYQIRGEHPAKELRFVGQSGKPQCPSQPASQIARSGNGARARSVEPKGHQPNGAAVKVDAMSGWLAVPQSSTALVPPSCKVRPTSSTLLAPGILLWRRRCFPCPKTLNVLI